MADLTAEKNNRLLTLPEPLFYRPSSPCSHCEVNNKNASDVSPCPRLSITQGTACRPLWELMTRDFKCSGAISIIKFSVCFQPLVYVLQKAKKKNGNWYWQINKELWHRWRGFRNTGGADDSFSTACQMFCTRTCLKGCWEVNGGRHRRRTTSTERTPSLPPPHGNLVPFLVPTKTEEFCRSCKLCCWNQYIF